jgi:hypothetical protein
LSEGLADDMGFPVEGEPIPERKDGPVPILPTGFGDAEDAKAFLAQRFNGLFCPNCEQYWNKEDAGVAKDGLLYCAECGPRIAPALQEFGHERPWLQKYYVAKDGHVREAY